MQIMKAAPATPAVVEWIKRDFDVINLGIFFDEALLAYPDQVAAIDLTEPEPRQYTFTELESEVRRAALALERSRASRSANG
jgi:hypothetical protein